MPFAGLICLNRHAVEAVPPGVTKLPVTLTMFPELKTVYVTAKPLLAVALNVKGALFVAQAKISGKVMVCEVPACAAKTPKVAADRRDASRSRAGKP